MSSVSETMGYERDDTRLERDMDMNRSRMMMKGAEVMYIPTFRPPLPLHRVCLSTLQHDTEQEHFGLSSSLD